MSQPTPSRVVDQGDVLAEPLVRELLGARLVAVLATIEPDGSPHAVPVWVAPAPGRVVLATGSRSRKVRNLERDARATLVLHDSRAGMEICGVTLHGRVEIVRGPEAAALIELVHLRYVTASGLALPDVASFLGSDDVALTFVAERAITWDERASGAALALREHGGAIPLEPTSPRPLPAR